MPQTHGGGKGREPRPLFVASRVYRRPAFGAHHPLAIARIATVYDLCRMLGWLGTENVRIGPPASEQELAAFHDRAYIAALRQAERDGTASPEMRRRFHIGTRENPIFPGLFERAATTVGGSMLAARLAAKGRVVFHPSGGTHHGRPDRASGFCYFNDPVFAIRTLLDEGIARVLYVDLDAHHGDGVEAAFAAEARVFCLSVHEEGRWPQTGSLDDRAGGNARNFPVPAGFNDTELDYLLDEALLPLGARFDPGAVVVTCGADGLEGDPLSAMALSNGALWRATLRLARLAPATVILGGGGYNPWTTARCWTGLWGLLIGAPLPERLPGAAQALLGALACDLIDEDEMDPAWLTTLADAPSPGPVRAAVSRLPAVALAV